MAAVLNDKLLLLFPFSFHFILIIYISRDFYWQENEFDIIGFFLELAVSITTCGFAKKSLRCTPAAEDTSPHSSISLTSILLSCAREQEIFCRWAVTCCDCVNKQGSQNAPSTMCNNSVGLMVR